MIQRKNHIGSFPHNRKKQLLFSVSATQPYKILGSALPTRRFRLRRMLFASTWKVPWQEIEMIFGGIEVKVKPGPFTMTYCPRAGHELVSCVPFSTLRSTISAFANFSSGNIIESNMTEYVSVIFKLCSNFVYRYITFHIRLFILQNIRLSRPEANKLYTIMSCGQCGFARGKCPSVFDVTTSRFGKLSSSTCAGEIL